MQFGITFDTHVSKWDLIRYAEELGYDRAWVPDSQMIWSDCYATLALAAVNTKRIKIGTGIAVAGTRIAPVTAHSIATINQLAPGRVFLGIGTGNTAMRVMGQDSMPAKEFREYLRVVRELLDGKAVDYTYRGRTREIQFLHRDRYFINLDNHIPIYVAANGPKACEAVGAYGDGWTTIGRDAGALEERMKNIRAGAKAVGRELGKDFHTTLLTAACVLRPGEKLTSERVIDETGSWVTCELHMFYEIWKALGEKDEMIPSYFANVWQDYVKRVASFRLPENARFREIHDGHCTYVQPEERRFVTPEAIRVSCVVGTPDEIVEQIRALEKQGTKEINLLPSADTQKSVWRDFAEKVMPAFR
ncbi:MAG: LLM class flavin-dependent oxidoreductase [Candidatus Binataceae bacterium]|jgi:alkanesulfonate monooxygenase SsuD/methylene tetrahydromethanopterin reductase-like flavin-dependent oxidoreductase (luciferase family)